jgi:hypothetical protein
VSTRLVTHSGTGGGRQVAILLLIAAGLGAVVPLQAARPAGPAAEASVVHRVAIYPVRVALGGGERLLARPLPARLLRLEKRGEVWEETPLALKRLARPRLRTLGRRHPAARCAPRAGNRATTAYPPVQLTARGTGAAVGAVFALARRAPARELRSFPGNGSQVRGRRYWTKWFELCASAQAEATKGARIDTVVAILSAASRKDRLIGSAWGTQAQRGRVRRAGELLRGRAIAPESGLLSGGLGPNQISPADFDRYLANQTFGSWEAAWGAAQRGPVGNTALGLFELPLEAPAPEFLVEIAVAYDP